MYTVQASIDISNIFNRTKLIGVYILYNEIECRYIGESTDVVTRIYNHYGLLHKNANSGSGYRMSSSLLDDKIKIVKFIEINDRLLRMVSEAFWTWKLKPSLAARPSPYPVFKDRSDKEVFEFIKADFKSRETWKHYVERRL